MKSKALFGICVAFVMGFSSMAAGAAQECVKSRRGNGETVIVCKQVDSLCLKDRNGETFCSPVGGGIVFDLYGVPVCGPGDCVRVNVDGAKFRSGDTVCSSEPQGAVTKDQYGAPACSGSCIPADRNACVKPG